MQYCVLLYPYLQDKLLLMFQSLLVEWMLLKVRMSKIDMAVVWGFTKH